MPKKIDTSGNDPEARIRFHISSARMSIGKISFIAFQRFLDDMERSMYLCSGCGWRGRGLDLVATETDANDTYAFENAAETWFACPKCETAIPVDHPILKST